MENPVKSAPKDVFLHLFNIVTFYLSVVGFIILYVQYVNVLFPDKLNYYFTAIRVESFSCAFGGLWCFWLLYVGSKKKGLKIKTSKNFGPA